MSKTICFWSGGKDAALALYEDQLKRPQEEYVLLVSMSTDTDRALMQGIRREVLRQQAQALNLEVVFVDIPPAEAMDVYEKVMTQAILQLKSKGYQRIIAGDIFLEDLKEYRIKQAEKWGLQIDFPIFGRESADIIKQMEELEFNAPIVALDLSKLDENYLGKNAVEIKLPNGIDPCGEYGEFHTLILNHPLFIAPLKATADEKRIKSYQHDGQEYAYAFLDYK